MPKEINIERDYPYPIEKVWEAISTPESLAAWLMPNNFKLEKGYSFTFKTKPQPGFDGIVNCRVLDFEIPRKLQFTWQGGPLKKSTLVTFTLQEIEHGTKLIFSHSGFEGIINQYIIRFILGSGWRSLFDNTFEKYLSK
jgi:uncharacterized protein YndB with AHSA1/START domain